MIKFDATKTIASIEEAAKVIERKLKNMVTFFVRDVVLKQAIEHTPYGDYEANENLYKRRLVDTRGFLPAAAGYARSSWSVRIVNYEAAMGGVIASYGDSSIAKSMDRAASSSIQQATSALEQNPKLGRTIRVLNNAPYIISRYNFYGRADNPKFSLEKGLSDQAPDGIRKPTFQAILNIYKADLKTAYNQG